MRRIAPILSLVLLSIDGVIGDALLRERAICNADNCARAVTGDANIKKALSSRSADCSAFQRVTATPPPLTITTTTTITPTTSTVSTYIIYEYSTTVTVTTTTTPIPDKMKRLIDPPATSYSSISTVPTYVSTQCGIGTTALSRYSSACSCFGFTRTTILVPVQPVTTTMTETAATPLTTLTTTVTTASTTTTEGHPSPTCRDTSVSNGEGHFDQNSRTWTVSCQSKYSDASNVISASGFPNIHMCMSLCPSSRDSIGVYAVNYYRDDYPDEGLATMCVCFAPLNVDNFEQQSSYDPFVDSAIYLPDA